MSEAEDDITLDDIREVLLEAKERNEQSND